MDRRLPWAVGSATGSRLAFQWKDDPGKRTRLLSVNTANVSYETDRRGTPRESPLALGTVAQGARHRTATARATALACRRHFTFDMVQAVQEGTGRGHNMRDLRPR
jgi:hypothetical protein